APDRLQVRGRVGGIPHVIISWRNCERGEPADLALVAHGRAVETQIGKALPRPAAADGQGIGCDEMQAGTLRERLAPRRPPRLGARRPRGRRGLLVLCRTLSHEWGTSGDLLTPSNGGISAKFREMSPLGIRVNAVAPGPIWTPLIPASFDPAHVANHGASTPMGRSGQPNEVAPCYVFPASEEASYISGQVLHPNGATVVAS